MTTNKQTTMLLVILFISLGCNQKTFLKKSDSENIIEDNKLSVNSEQKDSTTLNKKMNNIIYKILDGACGTIVLDDDLHTNFDEAVKTLEKKQKALLSKDYIVKKELFKIDYNKDDRKFYGVSFPDSKGVNSIVGLNYVIDTKGSIYVIDWCKD